MLIASFSTAPVHLPSVRRLGVPQERWVYLHGSADTYEYPVQVSQRKHPDRCFAMAAGAEEVLRAAGLSSFAECKHFDIYSCFPVAVSTAMREMRLPTTTDGADLTLTGGLPYGLFLFLDFIMGCNERNE